MIDTYLIKPPFTLIYLFLLLLFFPTTRFVSPLHLPILSASPFSSFKIFSHMKLLAQLHCLLFFFFSQLFFPNSVRLLLDFPSINPVRLPQKNFMFSHMFLWVFFFLDVLMLNVSCEMGFIFIFFGSTDTGCFLRIVILVFIFFFYVGCFCERIVISVFSFL